MKLSAHFNKEELACQCCGKIGKWPDHLQEILRRLESIYIKAGNKKPIITSAYRCAKHNKEVGGVNNSYHTQCMAVDLYFPDVSVLQTAILAKAAGFTGIGRYFGKGFVHCDIGPAREWSESE